LEDVLPILLIYIFLHSITSWKVICDKNHLNRRLIFIWEYCSKSFGLSHVACSSGLSFHILFVSIYFSIVFIYFCITVYPATVSTPGCPAPALVSVKKYENRNGRAIFRPFSSLIGIYMDTMNNILL
jgi:hypothetical protein